MLGLLRKKEPLLKLVKDKNKLIGMKKNSRKIGKRDAAEKIMEEIDILLKS